MSSSTVHPGTGSVKGVPARDFLRAREESMVLGVPWFPDFANAAELARRSVRAAGHADPVAQYLAALADGDVGDLENTWRGEVVVHDPRAGEVRGHRRLRRFIKRNQGWLTERKAHVETVASTTVGDRAVVELAAHLLDGGQEVVWPLAVVAESPDQASIVFRTYCSQWPVDGRRHLRPPVLRSGAPVPADVVGRHITALASGDVEALVRAFAPEGCLTEAVGPPYVHRGHDELRAFYADQFRGTGGTAYQCCEVTDDGVRCAVEYNCDSWQGQSVPPQAGIAVYERDAGGLLAAVRLYDDIEAAAHAGSGSTGPPTRDPDWPLRDH